MLHPQKCNILKWLKTVEFGTWGDSAVSKVLALQARGPEAM